jgi:hypothetical protein
MTKSPLDLHIFQKIRQLGLPDGEYVIVGGGVLAALGLQEWNGDIDICVSAEVFESFEGQGWKQEEAEGKMVLKHDDYDLGVGFAEWSLEDLLADALEVRGIRFISPAKLLEWKRRMNRPKDEAHIALLEKYLKQPAR